MAASPRTSSTVPPSANGITPPSVTSGPTRRLTAPRLLFAAGLVGLIKWVVAMLLGVGDIAHVFLLVSLMLLMLAVLKARDAAMRPTFGSESEKR
jgi:Flp pilus assembly protein TadB